jgi:hypothetical protein
MAAGFGIQYFGRFSFGIFVYHVINNSVGCPVSSYVFPSLCEHSHRRFPIIFPLAFLALLTLASHRCSIQEGRASKLVQFDVGAADGSVGHVW